MDFLTNKYSQTHGRISEEYPNGDIRIVSPSIKMGGTMKIKKNQLKHWNRVTVPPLGEGALQEEVEL